MQTLAGKPVVIRVRRYQAPHAEVDLFVPPSYHAIIPGIRLEMGKVTAVRDDSPARKAGVQAGDILTAVLLADAEGKQTMRFSNLDPLRLPDQLRSGAEDHAAVKATLIVKRGDATETLGPVDWDNRWKYSQEEPMNAVSPLSIPELGLAYQVKNTIAEVQKDSLAYDAGLREGDTIQEVRFKELGKKDDEADKWGDWIKLRKDASADTGVEWPHLFWQFQLSESKNVQLRVKHGDGAEATIPPENAEDDKPVKLLQPDKTWPLHDPLIARGLYLRMPQARVKQADSISEAIWMGMYRTKRIIVGNYLGLKNMITGRLPATENLHGPIFIATAAFAIAGEDLPQFLVFMAMISIGLAVINFLPIPVLDGGHMVFLIYEKLRGKPASEGVRIAATYAGVLFILSLMALAVYVDVKWLAK
jgi:regulator of sigma E protease